MAAGGPPPLRPPPLPPRDLGSRKLTVRRVDPGALIRLGGDNYPPLNFRSTGNNRFDAPGGEYGTLYAAGSLEVCFAETLLRGDQKTNPLQGGYTFIPERELAKFSVVALSGSELELAVLSGVALKQLGGDGGICTVTPYSVPQAWSLALHSHPAKVDGLVYMSRHINDMESVVLFERAKGKLRGEILHGLLEDPRLEDVLEALQIAV